MATIVFHGQSQEIEDARFFVQYFAQNPDFVPQTAVVLFPQHRTGWYDPEFTPVLTISGILKGEPLEFVFYGDLVSAGTKSKASRATLEFLRTFGFPVEKASHILYPPKDSFDREYKIAN